MKLVALSIPKKLYNTFMRFSWLIILFLLASCTSGQLVGPTITPTPTVTPEPTLTPIPTATFALTPTNTATPTPTETYQPRQVELVFAPDEITVPDSCKVIPKATADNTLTLNGQPLPDGTMIDSYQAVISPKLGEYHQSVLLVSARPVGIEKLSPDPSKALEDPYLLCYNVKLLSGDNMVLATVFDNMTSSGFKNTVVYTLPDTDVGQVVLDQTAQNATPVKVMGNGDFVALFRSIIGQEVLLPIGYDYPNGVAAAKDNPVRQALIDALKAGQLPASGYFDLVSINTIGANLVVPASLVP